jgi:aspartyl-tRNA(Asn)/glutamyl-tRNA(Gln) amidotransferase subunit A
MTNGLASLTLTEIKAGLAAGKFSAVEVFRDFRDAYRQDLKASPPLGGYVEFFDDNEGLAEEADKAIARGQGGHLCGLPIAVKDNIAVQGRTLTCASRVLAGYRAPYSATVMKRLLAQGAIPLGRTNMDEFAMGSTCEHSAYGPARNPVDRTRVTGGSSGGSAAVVAARQAPAALGSDTGGSVRLPASFCGVYGFKPTYGALSRYGLVAYGSSLDQIGVLARSPEDVALVFRPAAGLDRRDNTSRAVDLTGLDPLAPARLSGRRVALPREFTGEGIDPEVRARLDGFKAWLEKSGAVVKEISVPLLEHAIAVYYIIATAEASSNLGRYDGVQYGPRSGSANLMDMYFETRTQGFGSEVKRRIFLGNYVLSSGYYDAYYKKAQAVRRILMDGFASVFKDADFVLSPTSPVPAFKLGEKLDNPLAMYLLDAYTTYANLLGTPAVSLPAGKTADGLPVGVQLSGPAGADARLLAVAQAWHKEGAGR